MIIRMARARGGGGDPRGMTIETMNYLAEASRPHRRKPPCWRGGVASQLHEQPVDVKLRRTLIDQGQTVREHSPNFYFYYIQKKDDDARHSGLSYMSNLLMKLCRTYSSTKDGPSGNTPQTFTLLNSKKDDDARHLRHHLRCC